MAAGHHASLRSHCEQKTVTRLNGMLQIVEEIGGGKKKRQETVRASWRFFLGVQNKQLVTVTYARGQCVYRFGQGIGFKNQQLFLSADHIALELRIG